MADRETNNGDNDNACFGGSHWPYSALTSDSPSHLLPWWAWYRVRSRPRSWGVTSHARQNAGCRVPEAQSARIESRLLAFDTDIMHIETTLFQNPASQLLSLHQLSEYFRWKKRRRGDWKRTRLRHRVRSASLSEDESSLPAALTRKNMDFCCLGGMFFVSARGLRSVWRMWSIALLSIAFQVVKVIESSSSACTGTLQAAERVSKHSNVLWICIAEYSKADEVASDGYHGARRAENHEVKGVSMLKRWIIDWQRRRPSFVGYFSALLFFH